ncbi:MAG: ABC transporter permease, partial [Pseudolabrys sp.]
MSQEKFWIVEKPLTPFERLYNQNWLRKLFVLIVIAVCWELYARWLDNELLVPTFSATVRALVHGIASGVILTRAALSIKVLLMGFSAGVFIAALLTLLAINTRLGNDFLETMTAMFNPLPAIALLPLALIWFGLGTGSLVFVLIHS